MDEKHYQVSVTWTGNRGHGTRDYRSYDRSHDISAAGKPTLQGSSDPAFRGDAARWNPEELLVASLSSCHQLWYLHLASAAGIIVTAYVDQAEGTMVEDETGGGRFVGVTLRPAVTISAAGDTTLAASLHERAHAMCFIANSVNFPVSCVPEIIVGP